MPDESSTSPIILIIFMAILVFYYYVFNSNPYYVLNYARIPIMIGCFITIFCVLIFIEYYSNQASYQNAGTNELWPNFLKFLYKYFFYLFYLFSIAIIAYGVFKAIEAGLLYSFQYSFLVTVGLIFLVLALFTNNSKEAKFNSSFNSSYLDLMKTIIMYIPCLITDAIDFIKKDYTNTPSTVFIVFVLIMFYLLFFYMIPFFRKQQYKNDGVLLVEKAAYLNTTVLSITTNELKEKIFNQRPFYDRWFQKMLAQQSNAKEVTKKTDTETEIIETTTKTKEFNVPPDKITMPYYLKKQEGFNSLQVEDSQMIPFHMFKSRLKNDYETTDKELEEYEERNLMQEFIEEHPQVLTVIEKLQYMYSTAFASWDTLKSIPFILSSDENRITKYNYHYSITAWVYLQQIQSNKIQHIYSFGNRPSLFYDPVESSLVVVSGHLTPNYKILYKTNKILFQRWNFIVMNYRHGTLDLFINNNLVGTYTKVLSHLNTDDILIVGSSKNERIGGICNMKYYELPLGIRKIDTIYKSFHNKKIPI
jgi:hypothetical protein